ncbi:unnamed protein product [Alopecurus aequalis]
MTHQTLISSAPAFSSAPHLLHASSSSFPFPRPRSSAAASVMSSSFAHHHGSLAEREGSMSALRSSLRPYEADEEASAAMVAGPAAWGAAGLLGDGFLVDDLLDLEELCEVEQEGGSLCEAAPAAEEEEEQKCSDSHGSSVVSYELMPFLPPEMVLPAHDAEELEWVSRIMDDSLAELPPPPRLPAAPSAMWRPKQAALSTAAYPMRTPTICALSTEALVPVTARKRSKRSRATTVWSLSGASISDSASSSNTGTTSSSSSSASLSSFFLLDSPAFVASNLLNEPPRSKKSKHGKPKKRGRKPKHHFPPHLSAGAASPPVQGDRRCSHCGVQKTPQWRAGPEGAKTLCNACGVRFKSGRLLPEYRPACSPTFVGDLHSNSHRKVLEMRRKKDPVTEAAVAAPTVTSF